MFLANSLKEKIKKNFLEVADSSEGSHAKFRYESPQKDPRLIVSYKETMNNLNTEEAAAWNISPQQLKALDKKEWEETFTLNRLHSKWKGQMGLDFETNFKKFSNDVVYPRAIPAKEYVKELRDPDILELKKKRWNFSTNPNEKAVPELKQTVFQVEQGLGDFTVVPLKEPKVIEGTDSRNHLEIDGSYWNYSNLLDKVKMKEEGLDDLTSAQENSVKYWKNNEESRFLEKPFPLSEDRKKVEVIRFFKEYRSTLQKSKDYYKTMEKVKQLTTLEREMVEKDVKYRNPGKDRYPEKINAMVFKEMYPIFKNKYKELTGKLDREELKKKQLEEKKFKWKDDDLANKITAINRLGTSGILEKNFKSPEKGVVTNRLCQSTIKKKKNLLLPLVIKGPEIFKEEEKIEEKLQEEYKKKQKLKILEEAKRFRKVTVKEEENSKYPLSKEEYEFNKKFQRELSGDFSNRDIDLLDKKIKKFIYLSTSPNKEQTSELLNEISLNAECGPHFLEAYSKVAGVEMEKILEKEKKNKKLKFEYIHPGTYREFTFDEKVPRRREIGGNSKIGQSKQVINDVVTKKITEKFWSCCMNSDEKSRGCQKIPVKSSQFLYNESGEI